MKKYFIIAAAAALALASCSKVTMDEAPDQLISFQAANYATSTKAGPDEHGHLELYKDGTFGVYAWFTPQSWAIDTDTYSTTPFMNNVEVGYTTENNVNTWAPTANQYYWPKTGAISFVGYYPYSESDKITKDKYQVPVDPNNPDGDKKWVAGVKFTNYAVVASAANQQAITLDGSRLGDPKDFNKNDLMEADFIKDQTGNSNSIHYTNGVPMIFRHLLAKVQIKAAIKRLGTATDEPDGTTYTEANGIRYAVTLDEIMIDGIKNTATYESGKWGDHTLDVVSSGTFYTSNFSEQKPNTDTGIYDSKKTDEENGKNVISYAKPLSNKLTQIGADYFVMPQALSPVNTDDTQISTITIKYTVYVIDENGKILSKKQYCDTPTDGQGLVNPIKINTITKGVKDSTEDPLTAVTSWAKNTVYTYNLYISPVSEDPIYFDACVVDWDKVNTNAIETK